MYKLLAQHYDRKETGYSFPFVYLHGKIEEINGYDIVTKEKDEEIPFGIHSVIVNVQGKEYKCKLYVWDTRTETNPYKQEPRWAYQKGLICLEDDKESMKDAYKKYKERRSHV